MGGVSAGRIYTGGENISTSETHIWHGLHFSNVFAVAMHKGGRNTVLADACYSWDYAVPMLFSPAVCVHTAEISVF
jgi:hypothetical protein